MKLKVKSLKSKVKSRIFDVAKNPPKLPTTNYQPRYSAAISRILDSSKAESGLPTKRGFTLIFAVLVATLLLALGLGIFNIIIKELTISSTIRDSQIAFSAADTGAECTLFWDRKYPDLEHGAFGGIDLTGLNEGLVGHWKLDDGTGSAVAEDSSTNGNDGTLVNMDTANDWVSGEIGGALDFDGTDDYVDVVDSEPISFTSPGLTIAAWVNLKSAQTGERAIVRKNNQWQLGIFPADGRIRNLVMTDGITGWTVANDENFPFSTGVWYHLAFTYDGSSLQHYADGSTVGGLKTVTGNIVDNDNDPALGSNTDNVLVGGNSLNADVVIDDVRIYNRALDADEISALYSKGALQRFVPQVDSGSGVMCDGEDISSGWDTTGTNISNDGDISNDIAVTEFNVNYIDDTCSTVTITKQGTTTKIDSRGYNTCDTSFPRRVERGLRVTY